VAAGARMHGDVVESPAKHLGLGEASRIGPHIHGCDGVAARVESKKPMPECRQTDGAGFLGGPVGMDGVQTRDDRLQQALGIMLDAPVTGQPRGVPHLVGAPCDRPTFAVVKRGPRGRGPDVERDDH